MYLAGVLRALSVLVGRGKGLFCGSRLFDEDDRQGQLPISVRKGIMMEGDPWTSSRFLARSVRLYAPQRELKSVTTSYHQLVDGD